VKDKYVTIPTSTTVNKASGIAFEMNRLFEEGYLFLAATVWGVIMVLPRERYLYSNSDVKEVSV
jgi:hypothetical protein